MREIPVKARHCRVSGRALAASRPGWGFLPAYFRLIRNSSRFAPAFSFSTSHFGVNPLPDHVAPD